MDFVITTIPHDQQRYATPADWQPDESGVMQIKVSDTGNEDFNFLLAVHELLESYHCYKQGVSASAVDIWDFTHLASDDPGSLPGSPYKRWHLLAELYERSTCYDLDCDWEEYERAINRLEKL